MLLSSVVVPSNETREKKQVELEDDENGLFLYCKLMRTKWNLIIENKIRIER
jgi:hypothetical protein